MPDGAHRFQQIRVWESIVELGYQFALGDNITIQPNLQVGVQSFSYRLGARCFGFGDANIS